MKIETFFLKTEISIHDHVLGRSQAKAFMPSDGKISFSSSANLDTMVVLRSLMKSEFSKRPRTVFKNHTSDWDKR